MNFDKLNNIDDILLYISQLKITDFRLGNENTIENLSQSQCNIKNNIIESEIKINKLQFKNIPPFIPNVFSKKIYISQCFTITINNNFMDVVPAYIYSNNINDVTPINIYKLDLLLKITKVDYYELQQNFNLSTPFSWNDFVICMKKYPINGIIINLNNSYLFLNNTILPTYIFYFESTDYLLMINIINSDELNKILNDNH